MQSSNFKNPLRQILDLPPFARFRYARRYGSRYSKIAGFKRIDGWLLDSEANKLFDIASSLPGTSPVIAELGSWVGKSSVVLSQALNGRGKLYCIDPFNAAGEDESLEDYQTRQNLYQKSLRETFQSNIARYGCPEVVEFRQTYSYELAPTWSEPLDFVFIDASHDYDSVLQDYQQWSPHIKVGGYIAFHDIRLLKPSLELSGPGKVVKDHIVGNDCWAELALNGSLFSARKQKTFPPSPTK